MNSKEVETCAPEAQLIDTRATGTFKLCGQTRVSRQKASALSPWGDWAGRLAGYLPSCTGGSALSWDRKEGRGSDSVAPGHNARHRSRSTEQLCKMTKKNTHTQGPIDMTGISNTHPKERGRVGGGSREGDGNNCSLGLPPQPSTWDHWLLWPSPRLLQPPILDGSLQHCRKAILLLHASYFPDSSRGDFQTSKLLGSKWIIALNVVLKNKMHFWALGRKENLLISVWIKQYRSTQCMWMHSDLYSDVPSPCQNAWTAEPSRRPAFSLTGARIQPPSSPAYLPSPRLRSLLHQFKYGKDAPIQFTFGNMSTWMTCPCSRQIEKNSPGDHLWATQSIRRRALMASVPSGFTPHIHWPQQQQHLSSSRSASHLSLWIPSEYICIYVLVQTNKTLFTVRLPWHTADGVHSTKKI